MRPRLILVCGPWGCGTTAVTGALIHAGLVGFGPFFRTSDPRTVNSYELIPFRDTVRSLASEKTLRLTVSTPEPVELAVEQLRDSILSQELGPYAPDRDPPLVMKYALSSLILQALDRVFELSLIIVTRPLEAIEATRLRRAWKPQFGAAGARLIYAQLFDAVIAHGYRCHIVHSPHFLSAKAAQLDRMLEFVGHTPTPERRDRALDFVRSPG